MNFLIRYIILKLQEGMEELKNLLIEVEHCYKCIFHDYGSFLNYCLIWFFTVFNLFAIFVKMDHKAELGFAEDQYFHNAMHKYFSTVYGSFYEVDSGNYLFFSHGFYLATVPCPFLRSLFDWIFISMLVTVTAPVLASILKVALIVGTGIACGCLFVLVLPGLVIPILIHRAIKRDFVDSKFGTVSFDSKFGIVSYTDREIRKQMKKKIKKLISLQFTDDIATAIIIPYMRGDYNIELTEEEIQPIASRIQHEHLKTILPYYLRNENYRQDYIFIVFLTGMPLVAGILLIINALIEFQSRTFRTFFIMIQLTLSLLINLGPFEALLHKKPSFTSQILSF
jgi:hypothetical protein